MRPSTRFAGPAASILLALSACGSSGTPSITGVWEADDGTALKTINADGSCSGMYYNNGKPLDIGGRATCTLSQGQNSSGGYTMIVRQPPNERTYSVKFLDDDTMLLQDVDVQLARQ